ncbi:LysR family transcriptional regulator [Burkholderia contaminans]|uniref:LysR family transcriptional regulator n=1 Tax=Burkholderia contaminans TaxID=488447 RepID=UPI0009E33039|nr:LysR family transcriptional regulator [Burkholderia contaminans]MCA7884928.1 LysR family transcriptional regulator [Burkholderia contaminans]MEB4642589.1 LysR family transcriptional regulator [Burkholderia contaminans]MEB4657580.1 LysR family transcriptional regulator [Burkholderia contaminans]MEB4658928.1 LysR family transcriptional regulator [Burkholderia contaminans]MEB4672912.1 LysR family transcriptional regulator [Burkholderia contaminans]
MDKITNMRIFARVAEVKSFTAAAEHLQCTTGSVSRAVSTLEIQLRARLLNRTTRSISLTEPGEHYYRKCKKILADLEDAETEVGTAHLCARGQLKVHCMPEVGRVSLTHAIVDYRRDFPAVSVNLRFAPRTGNLVEEHVDVSIVSAKSLPNSENVAKRVGECRRVLVAAPSFVREHAIETIDDLSPHALTPIPLTARSVRPAIQTNEPRVSRESDAPLVVDDPEAVRFALLAGFGVGVLPLHCVVDDIHEGRLVPLFPDQTIECTSIFIVYPCRQFLDAKIATFVDFLTVRLRGILTAATTAPQATRTAFTRAEPAGSQLTTG